MVGPSCQLLHLSTGRPKKENWKPKHEQGQKEDAENRCWGWWLRRDPYWIDDGTDEVSTSTKVPT